MRVNEPRLSVSQHAAAEAFKHDQVLLRAVHKALPVLYQGKNYHIKLLRTGLSGGDVETTVYLSNGADVPAREVTLAPEIT
jgi:hypothetical protein